MNDALLEPGGTIAEKYRVQRVIGAGGMGVVFAAEHIELGRRVAIKVMTRDQSRHGDPMERFRREARAVARLQSAHVAQVIDFGALDNGSPFVVMEYLEGRDLGDEVAARGPLPIEEAVGYLLQACEGLAEAHGLGIVHRDLKPKNLFLARQPGGTPVVKVLDFGLAKTSMLEDGGITQSRDIFGSPAYMAPEQMRSAKDVDVRADVWALGVTLYELLAGKPPFFAPSVPEICALVLREAAPALEERRREVSSELARVVHRCLAKSPDERYASTFELAAALEPFRGHAGVDTSRRIRAILEAPSSTSAVAAPLRVEEIPTALATTREAGLDGVEPQPAARARAQRIGVAAFGIVVVAAAATVVALRARPPAEPPMPAPSTAAAPPITPSTEVLVTAPVEARPAESAGPMPVASNTSVPSAAPNRPASSSTKPGRVTPKKRQNVRVTEPLSTASPPPPRAPGDTL